MSGPKPANKFEARAILEKLMKADFKITKRLNTVH